MTARTRKWVVVDPEVHTKIMKLKYELRFKTVNEVLNFLIDFYLKHTDQPY